MILKRFFERARTRSSSDAYKQACLCTTAKRDSLYDDPTISLTKTNERPSVDQYGFVRTDKPRRVLMRQTNSEESDGDNDMNITEKLRRATSQSPANIPMLVVVSFTPDFKGVQKRQIEIQRGFPVNAQYIVNEWLFIKTADNEEGFVPYLCCRPVFRRQTIKTMENSYKPFDFQSNQFSQRKSPLIPIPVSTPSTNKKLSLSTNLGSPSYLFEKSSPYRKRQDMTSSSGGGDSGVSDCESSSNNHHQSLDLSTKRSTRLSNIRSLRSSSSTLRKTGLVVQDLPSKKSIKSQLSISTNSAFTQIIKKNPPPPPARQESAQLKLIHPNHQPDMSLLKNIISSPSIRRTPYTRRSLPYHSQSVGKKCSYMKSSSSPDPFKIIQEQKLHQSLLVESTPKYPLQKHFSDLSLNQIENDSLSPSTPMIFAHHRPLLSCSSSSATSSSSDSCNPNGFIHIPIPMNRTGRVPLLNNNKNSNHHIQPMKSNSFIHDVSITV